MMSKEITAELLRDALRDKKFLKYNYGIEIDSDDKIFSIICAFTSEDICTDYLEFKKER